MSCGSRIQAPQQSQPLHSSLSHHHIRRSTGLSTVCEVQPVPSRSRHSVPSGPLCDACSGILVDVWGRSSPRTFLDVFVHFNGDVVSLLKTSQALLSAVLKLTDAARANLSSLPTIPSLLVIRGAIPAVFPPTQTETSKS